MSTGPDPIVRVETFRVATPYRRSFVLGNTTAGDSATVGEVIFVRLETAGGAVGWGEQRALPSWSYETATTIRAVIDEQFAPLLLGAEPNPAAFHRAADAVVRPAVSQGFPFARAAVDVALHDLLGQLAGVPVSTLLGGRLVDTIPLCSAIGVDTVAATREHARAAADLHAYKIKVAGDLDHDVAAITAVAEEAEGKPLWLDANQSYRPSAARQLVERVRDTPGLWCIEQPVGSLDWGGLRRLRGELGLPVAIDEGCFSATDLARSAVLELADLVVIKTCKSAGLRGALRSAAVAEAHGIEILASGLTDCGIGFAAALHLFSGLTLSLPAELNGPELLADLYVDGLEIVAGRATVPTGPGLGVTVDEERIRRESRA